MCTLTSYLTVFDFWAYLQVKPEPGPSRPNDPRRRQQPAPNARGVLSSTSHHDYDQRQHRPRSRSRSPHRRSSESSYKSQRRDPPSPRRRTYAPIYIVDVQELYVKLMQTQVGSESVNAMSRQFGQSDVGEWCAGNEAM